MRRFKLATGLRPTEYAQQIRVEKARELLEHTRISVDQIAWTVGYGDSSAFRRIFQRVTGLAPAEYRRRFGVASDELTARAGTRSHGLTVKSKKGADLGPPPSTG
jgi:transcriptional regulator GlxA family with amidase domain